MTGVPLNALLRLSTTRQLRRSMPNWRKLPGKAKKRARISTLLGRQDVPHANPVEVDVQTQPEPQVVRGADEPGYDSEEQPDAESSQLGPSISSQPLAGRFAGGKKGSKAKKGRKGGF